MTNPTDREFPLPPSTLQYQHYGLTKREYFAAIAMQGLLSNGRHRLHHNDENGYAIEDRLFAQVAVEMADKLIAALNSQQT